MVCKERCTIASQEMLRICMNFTVSHGAGEKYIGALLWKVVRL